MQEIFVEVNNFLYSDPMIVVQIIAGIISFGLLIFYFQLVNRTGILRLKYSEIKSSVAKTPAPVSKVRSKWQEIERMINSDDETQWKFAIVEADLMLDTVLKSLGYAGENLDERLQNINPTQFPQLEFVQRLHKVRNFIARDPNYHIKHEIARRAIEGYHKIFNELGVQ